MTKANFLIAGSARSGTTALAAALATHPEIFFTTPKETHFFTHVDHPPAYTGPGDDLLINDVAMTDPAAFERLFDDATTGERRLGEGSVTSLYYYERAIPAITTYADPDCRILLLLREPTARMQSGYSYMRSRGHEPAESLEAGLALEEQRMAEGWCHMWAYEDLSHYGPQVGAFHDAFGDRLHIAVYEEFRRDPAGALADACTFLDIDPTFEFADLPETNRGGEPRSQLITKAMNGLRSSKAATELIRRAVPLQVRESIRNATLKQATPPERVQLRNFDEDRRVVEAILGREIGEWR